MCFLGGKKRHLMDVDIQTSVTFCPRFATQSGDHLSPQVIVVATDRLAMNGRLSLLFLLCAGEKSSGTKESDFFPLYSLLSLLLIRQ